MSGSPGRRLPVKPAGRLGLTSFVGRRTLRIVLAATIAACADTGRPPPARGLPPSAPSDSAPAALARYLALGDSFTIGTGSPPQHAFPARLADRWRWQGCALEVQNVAVNGYTSDDVVSKELPALSSFRPTFITVAVGANDIAQGHTIEAYRVNVRRILEASAATGARVVVIPQPDWSRGAAAAAFGPQDALAASIVRFNALLADEARANGASWVDLGPIMEKQAATRLLASDGLHPSAEAYDAWAAELARVLPLPCAGGG